MKEESCQEGCTTPVTFILDVCTLLAACTAVCCCLLPPVATVGADTQAALTLQKPQWDPAGDAVQFDYHNKFATMHSHHNLS